MRLITAFAGQARLIFALAVISDIGILRAAEHRGVFRVAVRPISSAVTRVRRVVMRHDYAAR